VLGAGNTGYTTAARLSLNGHTLTLGEIPDFAESISGIRNDKKILLQSPTGLEEALINRVTSDIALAIKNADVILLTLPAYAHKSFANECARYLTPGQIVILMPGTLGSLEFVRILKAAGTTGITVGEVDTSPYVCRKTGVNKASIFGTVTHLGLGVFPAKETDNVATVMNSIFPGISKYTDVLECGISSINPVIHPAGVIMNAGRIEYSDGEFYFYNEGVTASVSIAIQAVDKERIQIGKALGYKLKPVNQAIHEAGLGPKGNLYHSIRGSKILTKLKAPGTMQNRWLTEDIPYGIATWSLLGASLGIETPIMKSFIEIGSIVSGVNGWEKARNLTDLGINDLNVQNLRTFLKTGER